jgi:hypothetical protein
MRKPNVWFTVSLILSLCPLILISACASPPTEQAASAREALDQAREVEADTYAVEEFREAAEALKAAQAEIDAQENKWFFSRSYASAENLLEKARSAAQQAAERTPGNKEQAKMDAESASVEAEEAIETARQELSTAPRGKGTQAELEAMERDLLRAESTLEKARQGLQSGAYLDALSSFQSARETATAITEEVQAVRRVRR